MELALKFRLFFPHNFLNSESVTTYSSIVQQWRDCNTRLFLMTIFMVVPMKALLRRSLAQFLQFSQTVFVIPFCLFLVTTFVAEDILAHAVSLF